MSLLYVSFAPSERIRHTACSGQPCPHWSPHSGVRLLRHSSPHSRRPDPLSASFSLACMRRLPPVSASVTLLAVAGSLLLVGALTAASVWCARKRRDAARRGDAKGHGTGKEWGRLQQEQDDTITNETSDPGRHRDETRFGEGGGGGRGHVHGSRMGGGVVGSGGFVSRDSLPISTPSREVGAEAKGQGQAQRGSGFLAGRANFAFGAGSGALRKPPPVVQLAGMAMGGSRGPLSGYARLQPAVELTPLMRESVPSTWRGPGLGESKRRVSAVEEGAGNEQGALLEPESDRDM